jgi:hypothetical protein
MVWPHSGNVQGGNNKNTVVTILSLNQSTVHKTGHGPHLPNYFLLLCMFRSLYSVYCLFVNVCCTAATGCQPNCV